MTSAFTQAEACFNCGGSGTCLFYPHVERIVAVDAPHWLNHPALEWIEGACPYCDSPPQILDYFFGGPFPLH